jgi:hypothetical protein
MKTQQRIDNSVSECDLKQGMNYSNRGCENNGNCRACVVYETREMFAKYSAAQNPYENGEFVLVR